MLKNPTNLSIIAILSLIASIVFIGCNKDDNSEPSDDFRDYVFEEPVVSGNTFYIDPVNGSQNGDGSEANPWHTLQEVIDDGFIQFYKNTETNSELELVNSAAPVKGGDRLVLLNGYHGFIRINTFIFNDWITIEAQNGQNPILSQFNITGAFKNIYLKNLTILKESYEGTENYWEAEEINRNVDACIYFGSNEFWGEGSDVKMNGLTIKTAENISAWTANDWVQKAAVGISIRNVENTEIVNCRIENIHFGINFTDNSDNSVAVNNIIKNYSGDGSRIISNYILFAYNTITDCYKVDDNHDDAIQSYSRGEDGTVGTGVLYNNIIRGNLIIGITDDSNPLAGSPQGIGCFDGFFDNWIVENNVIITDHYHGISFYGMSNSMIANNTVIDQNPGNDTSPWILITDHKDGTPSENCTVANNIVFSSISVSGNNVSERNNYIIGRNNYSLLDGLFVNPAGLDFHLLVNDLTQANFIDKGEVFSNLLSFEIDKDKELRSTIPDLGAYEAK